MFKPELFKLFVKSVTKAAIANSEIELSKLSNDFNKFQQETIELLTVSVSGNNYTPNVIQLILSNGFDSFSTSERQELFDKIWAVNSLDKRDFNFYHLHKRIVENKEEGFRRENSIKIKPFNHCCLFYGIKNNKG